MKDVDFQESPLDPPPSYSDSICDSIAALSLSDRPLPPKITETRSDLIRSLLNNHIRPHLYDPALRKFSTRTLVLVPSDVLNPHPVPVVPADPGSYINPFHGSQNSTGFINERIIGFPSSANPLLIRLHGDENTLEFWHQHTVVRDLESRVQVDLSHAGYGVVKRTLPEEANRRIRKKRGILVPKAGWRYEDKQDLESGEVRVDIDIMTVCLRMENVMRLYETRGGEAIVVRLDFGS